MVDDDPSGAAAIPPMVESGDYARVAEAIRRVWAFPPGGRDLLPSSLVELSWRR